jgi:hypothetical protein
MKRWGDEGDEEDENKDVGTHRKSFPPAPCPPAPRSLRNVNRNQSIFRQIVTETPLIRQH